jgi:hypothetical protein
MKFLLVNNNILILSFRLYCLRSQLRMFISLLGLYIYIYIYLFIYTLKICLRDISAEIDHLRVIPISKYTKKYTFLVYFDVMSHLTM